MSIKIDGVEMPPIKEMTITREPTWSKNTGRGADGTMIGDIVAQKITLQITFIPMSDKEAAVLAAATDPAFFNVTFKDPVTNTMKTKRMYAGSLPFPVYSYVDYLPRYVGVGLKLVEK